MPTQETLNRFIARVEANAHTDAIAEFYTANATKQENTAHHASGATSWWRMRRPCWRGLIDDV